MRPSVLAWARPRRVAAPVIVVLAVAALAACQPVDRFQGEPSQPTEQVTETPLDAPVRGMPGSFTELIERAEPSARQWQDEPVLAEILVEVGRRSQWRRAALTYLAAEADRQLVVTVTADGISEELTTLAALQLRSVSARGMALVPPLPLDVKQPAELLVAARPALRDCGIDGMPRRVLYTSGAPAAWNGRRWSSPPMWTATILASGGAVQLDPVTTTLITCTHTDAST